MSMLLRTSAIISMVVAGILMTTPWIACADDEEFRVNVGAANVRRGPGTNNPVVTTVSENARLRVLGRDGQWVKVEVADRNGAVTVGFINGTLGTIVRIPTPPPVVVEPVKEQVREEKPAIPDPLASHPRLFASAEPAVAADLRQRELPPPRPAAARRRDTPAAPTTTKVLSIVDGGAIASNGKIGTLAGGSAAVFLFDQEEIAVQADAHFMDFEDTRGFYGSGNLVQYFHVPGLPFTPFAGAGVPVFVRADDLSLGVQVIFGFERLAVGRLSLGGQIRTSFVSGGPMTLLLAHASFGSAAAGARSRAQ
jgi:uncharacterized protein YraI